MKLTRTKRVIISGVTATVVITGMGLSAYAAEDSTNDKPVIHHRLMKFADDGIDVERIKHRMKKVHASDKPGRLPPPFIHRAHNDDVTLDDLRERLPELSEEELADLFEQIQEHIAKHEQHRAAMADMTEEGNPGDSRVREQREAYMQHVHEERKSEILEHMQVEHPDMSVEEIKQKMEERHEQRKERRERIRVSAREQAPGQRVNIMARALR